MLKLKKSAPVYVPGYIPPHNRSVYIPPQKRSEYIHISGIPTSPTSQKKYQYSRYLKAEPINCYSK